MTTEASAQRRGRSTTGAPSDIQMTFAFCQRWRERRDHRRPTGEPFDPTRYAVAPVDHAEARAFVEQHHYSGSYVAALVEVGLWHRPPLRRRDELVGVCVFSQPMNQRVIPARTGHAPDEGVELGRFVLLDEVGANAESWMLARAFRLLQQARPGVRAVVSYSDPVPRRTADGDLVMPGHVGTIYQAHNGRYVGRSCARRRIYGPDGREVSQRALSKLRRGEVGADYAYRDLLAMGAPRMRRGEGAAAYIQRALSDGPFTSIRHPGNHAYAWGLDRRAQRRLPKAAGAYPKAIEVAAA